MSKPSKHSSSSSLTKAVADSHSSLHTPTPVPAAKLGVSRFSKASPTQQSPPRALLARHSGSQDPEFLERATPKGRVASQATPAAASRDLQQHAQQHSPTEPEGHSRRHHSGRVDHSKRRREPLVWNPPEKDPAYSAEAGERTEPEVEEADKGIESGSAKRMRLQRLALQQGAAADGRRQTSSSLEQRLDRSEQQAAGGSLKAAANAPKFMLGGSGKVHPEHSDGESL